MPELRPAGVERLPDPALDELVARIEAEAARRRGTGSTPARASWPALASAAAITEPPPGAPAFEVRVDRCYDVRALLALDGNAFLDAAYRALLGRSPDPEGRRAFSARLAEGMRPVEILGRLRLSPEGRAHGAEVAGLWPRFVLASAYRTPVIGYVIEALASVFARPLLDRAQRRHDHALAMGLEGVRDETTASRRRLQAEIERLGARRH